MISRQNAENRGITGSTHFEFVFAKILLEQVFTKAPLLAQEDAREMGHPHVVLAIRLADGGGQLVDRPIALFLSDHCRGSEQKVIARDTIHAALHRIDE